MIKNKNKSIEYIYIKYIKLNNLVTISLSLFKSLDDSRLL